MHRIVSRTVFGIVSGITALSPAFAQVYNSPSGNGLNDGLTATNNLAVPHNANLWDIVVTIIGKILSYMALAAVVTIIAAGIYLIVSLGNESARDRAKNIILYTVIGLVIILFSELIVQFVLHILG